MRVLFADFVLDRATRQLLRDGKERHVEPKAFELLDFLLERRPEAVAKSEILERLWPGTFVSESSLTGLVAQVRRALGDDPRRARFVRTVHGFGYAFSADALAEPAANTRADRIQAKVIWEDQVILLESGQNVLGRDEDVTVRIDAPGISRRHARIVVHQGQATIEDLGSKNGTYLRERRLDAPAPLEDGDTFRLGRQLLVFRSSHKTTATVTEMASPRRSD
jgi:DNA-binding winged helix-turn-helix (wHTH) protein